MADKVILVDTSLLIDLFRKTDKANLALISLVRQGYSYSISVVTEYEIYTGATLGQIDFWDNFLQKTEVLPFDKIVAKVAVDIYKELNASGNSSTLQICLLLRLRSPIICLLQL